MLPLLPDDAKVDGHKVCTVVMEGASRCKFSFTNGSKMRLVVEDDESKRRRTTCCLCFEREQELCLSLAQTQILSDMVLLLHYTIEFFRIVQ